MGHFISTAPSVNPLLSISGAGPQLLLPSKALLLPGVPPSRLGLLLPLWKELFNPWVATVPELGSFPESLAEFSVPEGSTLILSLEGWCRPGTSCGHLSALGSEVYLGGSGQPFCLVHQPLPSWG